MRIGITCYPTYGGSGIVATELGLELDRQGVLLRQSVAGGDAVAQHGHHRAGLRSRRQGNESQTRGDQSAA